jgi:hypothetical protein
MRLLARCTSLYVELAALIRNAPPKSKRRSAAVATRLMSRVTWPRRVECPPRSPSAVRGEGEAGAAPTGLFGLTPRRSWVRAQESRRGSTTKTTAAPVAANSCLPLDPRADVLRRLEQPPRTSWLPSAARPDVLRTTALYGPRRRALDAATKPSSGRQLLTPTAGSLPTQLFLAAEAPDRGTDGADARTGEQARFDERIRTLS